MIRFVAISYFALCGSQVVASSSLPQLSYFDIEVVSEDLNEFVSLPSEQYIIEASASNASKLFGTDRYLPAPPPPLQAKSKL